VPRKLIELWLATTATFRLPGGASVRGGGAAVGPISHLIFPDRSDRPSSCGSHRNSGFRGASATPFGSPRTADNWICLPGSGNQTK